MKVKITSLLLVTLIALLIGGLTACGKKALPKPPESEKLPPPVNDLAAQMIDATLHLSWRVPELTDRYPVPAEGFIVLADKQSLGAPCPNCPPDYKSIGRLKVLGRLDDAAGTQPMRYLHRLENGYRYRLKVVAIGSDGTIGPDSNTVEIEH